MSLLVVGSIAYDDIETPVDKVNNSPGGSALYFSAAASLFGAVNVVGVVGNDFNFTEIEFLADRKVDFRGIKKEFGKTFRWGGKYYENMNLRDTIYTDLNVFENFNPLIPDVYKKSEFIFLANIDPDLQLNVLNNVLSPKISVLDTMNFWITGKSDALEKLLKKVDVMILNDEEIRQLTGIHPIIEAAGILLKKGPKVIVVKKGEHGALLISRDDLFIAPGFPVKYVMDPTGAGDSFAGGFLGYLASCNRITKFSWRKALIYGNIVASFTVEAFSFDKLKKISRKDVDQRFETYRKMTKF